jgi:hypothetical protein
MLRILCALGFAFLGGCVEITTFTSPSASGVVTDASTQQPIAGALISVKGRPSASTSTGSDGTFSLAAAKGKARVLPIGPYDPISPSGTLVISAEGYISQEVSVHGGINSLRVALEAAR